MPLMISEEASHGWTTIYRGTVSSAHQDVRALEEALPMWALEYLLTNKIPVIPTSKLSFVLMPWPNKDPEAEVLPELLNT
jgi:WD repeat-containing protein 48